MISDNVMGNQLEFRWLGVAGFELRTPGATLLIDPFLTRPPLHKLFFGRTRPDGELLRQYLPQADFILVSHAHYDHLLDVAEIAGYSGARVYGSANTCRIVEVCGLASAQVVRVRAGEVLSLTPDPSAGKGKGRGVRGAQISGEGEQNWPPQPAPFLCSSEQLKRKGKKQALIPSSPAPDLNRAFMVEVLCGEHATVPLFGSKQLPHRLAYPLRLRDFVLDEDFGFLIQAGETRLLSWHDWRPGPAPQADVLVIGADIHLSELGELIDQVQPRLLIPTHWDNFLRPLRKPLKPFFRPPCPGHWLPERYDPWAVQRWIARHRPGVLVYVPRLWERIDLQDDQGVQSGA